MFSTTHMDGVANRRGSQGLDRHPASLLHRLVSPVVLAVLISVFPLATRANATTLVVDDNLACPGATYPTITPAVLAAAPGDTIMVCAGTYNEFVSIPRRLTLLGPNAGVSGTGARGAEASVLSFSITASDVIVDGFSFSNPGPQMNINGTTTTILSGVIVKNNIFSGYASVGVPTFNAGNLLMTRNLFKLPLPNTEAMQIKAANLPGGGCSGTTVSNNVFRAATNNGGADINFSCTASNSTNVSVVGNVDTGLAGDSSFTAFAGVAGGIVIKNNYVIGATSSGSAVFFFGGVTGSVDINSNIIRNFDGDGIDVGFDPAGFGVSTGTFTFAYNDLSHNRRSIRLRTTTALDAFGPSASVTFHQNDLSGNTLQIGAQNDSPSLLADGTCNWWGSASGPFATDNPSGSGDAAVGRINYRPWLTHRAPSHCGPPPPPKCKPGEHDDGEGDVDEHDNNGHHRGHFKFDECNGDEEFSHQDSDRNVDFHSDSANSSAPTFDAALPVATTTGQGWNNGEPVTYTLLVTDLGIGPMTDLYSLTLSDASGVFYTITGTLTAGNINVSH